MRKANAERAALLTPLAKVTVSNMAVDLLNGDWVYVGDESIELSHKQGKMSIKLRKYDVVTKGNDIYVVA